jgi:uncharacterized membrane protein YhaH (DUF805 family)
MNVKIILEYIVAPYLRIFQFGGRTSQSQYICGFIFLVLLLPATCVHLSQSVLFLYLGVEISDQSVLVYFLGTYLAFLSMSIRRYHDTGKSGWWFVALYVLVPFLALIYLFFAKGDQNDNKYGSVPTGGFPSNAVLKHFDAKSQAEKEQSNFRNSG